MKPLCQITRGVRLLDSEKALLGSSGSNHKGMFALFMNGEEMHIVASSDGGWDHVSVSFQHRTPTWEEMETVKRMFFYPHETAMQLHVPPDEHINFNPNVLHIWRPLGGTIPRPPANMV